MCWKSGYLITLVTFDFHLVYSLMLNLPTGNILIINTNNLSSTDISIIFNAISVLYLSDQVACECMRMSSNLIELSIQLNPWSSRFSVMPP